MNRIPASYLSCLGLFILHIAMSKNQLHPFFSMLYVMLSVASLLTSPSLKFSLGNNDAPKNFKRIRYTAFILLTGAFVTAAIININHYPLNYKEADMLPVIDKMNDRFFHNQPVYAPISEIWGGTKPVYLPALWLPYGLPQLMGIDIRYMNIAAIALCFALLFKIARSIITLLAVTAISLLFFYYFTFTYAGFIRFTEEPVVCMYYLLLLHFLLKKNWTLIFLFATLCLMSRYWLLPWLPLLLIYSVVTLRKKWFAKAWPAILLLAAFLLIIPPAEYKWLFSLPNHYLTAVSDPGNAFKYETALARYGIIKFFAPAYYYLLPYIALAIPLLIQIYFWQGKRTAITSLHMAKMLAATIMVTVVCSLIPYEYLFAPLLLLLGYFTVYCWDKKAVSPDPTVV
jgi:hypothetical protein